VLDPFELARGQAFHHQLLQDAELLVDQPAADVAVDAGRSVRGQVAHDEPFHLPDLQFVHLRMQDVDDLMEDGADRLAVAIQEDDLLLEERPALQMVLLAHDRADEGTAAQVGVAEPPATVQAEEADDAFRQALRPTPIAFPFRKLRYGHGAPPITSRMIVVPAYQKTPIWEDAGLFGAAERT
jgi:hypothetical protein